MRKLYFLCVLLTSFTCFGQTREIALTIDDLPLVASKMDTAGNQQRATERFNKIIEALTINKIPATGFVIAGAIANGQWDFLEQFKKAGFEVGNHTYSHYNLNQMSAEKYIADLDKADKILTPLLTEPKYFRYPYLAEGNKTTKPKVLDYLNEKHYVIAPVTIDSKDFRFNEQLYHVPYRQREAYVNKLKARYLAFIWEQTLRAEQRAKGQPVKQILLIHANLLNSYALNDIIQMYKQNGYTFITLTEALKNPAPTLTLTGSENAGDANAGNRQPSEDDRLIDELLTF
ncbi:MAG: polysaccharide deacetylase family protein [Tatlockia sp.]|nr:polysaccharide deacetylase family protein [Tatlockia sp.]